jgi:hypothetical protein
LKGLRAVFQQQDQSLREVSGGLQVATRRSADTWEPHIGSSWPKWCKYKRGLDVEAAGTLTTLRSW